MGIEAVFFDVGGTLLYPNPSVAKTFLCVAQQRGHTLALADIESYMPLIDAYYEAEYARDGDFWCSHEGSTAMWLNQYRYLSHLAGIAHDAEGMAANVHEAYRKKDHWGLYADVEGCLKILKGHGIGLGVISNWDVGLKRLLGDLELLTYFDVVISSAEVGLRKPNPAIFNIACTQMGIGAHAAVHVGDRFDDDGDGAQAAGLYPIIINRHKGKAGCAHTCIADLADVIKLVGV